MYARMKVWLTLLAAGVAILAALCALALRVRPSVTMRVARLADRLVESASKQTTKIYGHRRFM